MNSVRHQVARQPLQSVAVGTPVSVAGGGDATVVVEVYALGRGVTLQDIDRDTASVYQYRDGGMDVTDRNGYRLELRRLRTMPECWRMHTHMQGKWRPGQWDVEEVRVDGAGRKWRTDLGPHITDDFGALVPVGGAA